MAFRFNAEFWNTPAKRRAFLRKFVPRDDWNKTQRQLLSELRAQGFRIGDKSFRTIRAQMFDRFRRQDLIMQEPRTNVIPAGLFTKEIDDNISRRFQYRLTIKSVDEETGNDIFSSHFISTDQQLSIANIEDEFNFRVDNQQTIGSEITDGEVVGIDARIK